MSKGIQLENLLNEYLLDIGLKNYSIRTLKSVKNNNLLFFAYLESEYGITTIEKVSHVHLKAYIKHKQTLGLKATYINSILRNVRMFFNYLEQEEYISTNYVKKVENVLSTLTEYEMRLIEMRYFKRYSIGRICGVLELSEDGFNKRRKNIIIKRLMPLFVA